MFDYGTYIFEQTVKHAATSAIKLPIAFPSLICGIILNQNPGILASADVACKRESVLSLHCKLFAGKHVPDIVLTSVEKKSSTKADVISDLKKTCKELGELIHTSTERKLNIERLIKNLEHTEGTRICDDNTTTKNSDATADEDGDDNFVFAHTAGEDVGGFDSDGEN